MMRFLAKTALQRLFATVPGGRAAYGLLQRHATRSTAPVAESIDDKHRLALDLIGWLAEAGAAPADLGPGLDIGAGWLPVVPIVLRRHGLAPQTLIDIAPVLRWPTVVAVARHLGSPAEDPDLDRWLARHDFTYLAPALPPYPLAGGSYGLVTCLQVLQYPKAHEVRAMHEEVARLLRPGGYYIATIRLDDQYALSDPTLSRFNFLRYDEARWTCWFANPFTPLNRLGAADHRALLDGLPFEIVAWCTRGGGPAELAELDRIRPAACFAHRPRADLALTGLRFILRRLPAS